MRLFDLLAFALIAAAALVTPELMLLNLGVYLTHQVVALPRSA